MILCRGVVTNNFSEAKSRHRVETVKAGASGKVLA
jgi:hypothetical protein